MNNPSNFYVDGKPWEPANTETERIANRVCDRYGVVDRVDFYRKVGSDYVLMEMENQEQARYLAEWRKHHPEDQQLSVREFVRQYGALIGAIVLYVLIVFSAFEAAKIF